LGISPWEKCLSGRTITITPADCVVVFFIFPDRLME
jgi:hypothetical protein